MNVPSHFKKCTIEGQKIVVQKPVRSKFGEGQSYDFPKKSKTVNLSQEGEDPKPILISNDLYQEEEEKLVNTLREYRDPDIY